MTFLPSKLPGISWAVLQTRSLACDVEATRTFVGAMPGSRFVAVSDAAIDALMAGGWPPVYAEPFERLMARQLEHSPAAIPAELNDLPLVLVPAQPALASSDSLAVLLSGDGGWAGLDKQVADALAAQGVPVIGLDSLRYFWSARTPASLAADIERIIGYYSAKLSKQRVLLIGYSQGADVLPFAINRLSTAARTHVALAAVMGMSEHALFEFHMSNWLADDNSGPPTLPEVEKIAGIPLLCIYGQDETDTLCPQLDPRKVTIVKLKGGHHFDGDYASLARTILSSMPVR